MEMRRRVGRRSRVDVVRKEGLGASRMLERVISAIVWTFGLSRVVRGSLGNASVGRRRGEEERTKRIRCTWPCVRHETIFSEAHVHLVTLESSPS
jgi:hypothetical protein